MTKYPSDRHLASWAGLVLGENESADKKTVQTRKGNVYLRGDSVEFLIFVVRRILFGDQIIRDRRTGEVRIKKLL